MNNYLNTNKMTEENIDSSYQMSRQKIILIGNVAVGKTSIINSLLGQKFNDEYEPSIGVDFFSKTMKYKGKNIKLQIWDSAGQERFKSLIPNYIRGSSLIFLIYDVTNKKSFEDIPTWLDFINQIETTTTVLCGNKIDLKDKREVTYEEGEKFANDKKMSFFEISAKEETNLQKMLFSSVAELPFFQNFSSERTTKEEIINDLVVENNESSTGPRILTESQNSKNLNVQGFVPDSSIANQSQVGEHAPGSEVKKNKKKCNC